MKKKIFLLFITNNRPAWIGKTFPVWLNGIDQIGTCELIEEGNKVYGILDFDTSNYEDYFFYTETSNLPNDYGYVIGFKILNKASPNSATRKLSEMFVN